MRVRVWALATALGVALAACQRDVEPDGLASAQSELTNEQVDRALGPEIGDSPGNGAGETATSQTEEASE